MCTFWWLKLSFDISLSSFYSFSVKVGLRHDKSTHIYIPWWFCSYFLPHTHSCVNITAYWRATVWFSAEAEVKILQSFDLTISWTAVIKFVVMFCFEDLVNDFDIQGVWYRVCRPLILLFEGFPRSIFTFTVSSREISGRCWHFALFTL